MSGKAKLLDLLTADLNVYERKLNLRLLEDLVERYPAWPGYSLHAAECDGDAPEIGVASFLRDEVLRLLKVVFALRARHGEFTRRYAKAGTAGEKERHVLEYARDLGARPAELEQDRKALQRWFGQDALADRFERQYRSCERRMVLYLGRLGMLAERCLKAETDAEAAARRWKALLLEDALKGLFAYDGDMRVAVAAFRCMSRALRSLPGSIQEASVCEATLSFIYRSAMHTRADVWLQCEALSLLETLSPSSLKKVLEQRLSHPAPGDDIFVRRRAVLLLVKNLPRIPEIAELLPKALADPSPFVRQGLAEALRGAPSDWVCEWLPKLCLDDGSPQVRAAALLAALALLERTELQSPCLAWWRVAVCREGERFALRVVAEVAARGAAQLVEAGSPFAAEWCARTLEGLESLHLSAKDRSVRRWAAQARERVWCESVPAARALRRELSEFLVSVAPGRRSRLPAGAVDSCSPDFAGRVLSVVAQDEFGFDVEWGRRTTHVTRGNVFGFRLWRLWHEMRNPSPDKRQAFHHTVGRRFRGDLRAPSSILAELAETKVPGEPLFLPEESGWRPYVPLVDELVSLLHAPRGRRRAQICTSEGVTEVVAPRSLWRRWRALWKLSRGFPSFAKMRNWRESSQDSPSKYLGELRQLGFEFRVHPYAAEGGRLTSVDPEVLRFFPALGLFSSELWESMQDYFVSAYDNSIFELAVFAGTCLALFTTRHLVLNFLIRRARNRIPLVVGGWGTRGKSGTERLKAALFNALGYGIVSKTTGCEAMFLYAYPFGKLREMFLYRPYDKATIWEQFNLVRLVEDLGCEVFLWECMALTPSYVEILQRSWMRDDLSTLTNAYPDHEDLQGPAGHNIPDVMVNFIPARSKMVTSEDQMLPIIRDAARRLKTELEEVTWLECGLLTPDVLKRFPYDEHPNNIALILGLADELGIDRDFALKEMADRVVQDLGVLKTYPIGKVFTRGLQLVNGMSANERHGSLGNWIRLGFDRQDPVAEPGVWITTVVNNRADRVPRSKVFAKMLVDDVSADRHFCIGTNLSGLVGYIRNAWESYAPGVRLWTEEGKVGPQELLLGLAKRFRAPTQREHVGAQLAVMLSAEGLPPELKKESGAILDRPRLLRERLAEHSLRQLGEDIATHVEEMLQRVKEYRDMEARVAAAKPAEREGIERDLRELLWKWFQRKVVVIEDPHSSGEQIIARIANETPPGFLNRIMGMQNIKGTGLDFIYRWQAWDACYKACMEVRSKDPARMRPGLKTLVSFQEFGLLSEHFVRDTIDLVKGAPAAQRENLQSELALVKSNLELAMQEVHQKLKGGGGSTSRAARVIHAAERFADAGDAVRRRRAADRIYKDLVSLRISLERAAYELQKLTKRQKGGWLLETVRSAQSTLSRQLAFLHRNLGK